MCGAQTFQVEGDWFESSQARHFAPAPVERLGVSSVLHFQVDGCLLEVIKSLRREE